MLVFAKLTPAPQFSHPVHHEFVSVDTPPGLGTNLALSELYKLYARACCFKLLRQLMPSALVLARLSAGNSMAARMAMMAMTTNNSIKVNPASAN